MGNSLPQKISKGTLGELLVQLRLFEYGIQSAPPLKDSGNDLIAIKKHVVQYIQVKTQEKFRISKMPNIYHYAVFVKLLKNKNGLLLDQSEIWFVKKGDTLRQKRLLSNQLIHEIWG